MRTYLPFFPLLLLGCPKAPTELHERSSDSRAEPVQSGALRDAQEFGPIDGAVGDGGEKKSTAALSNEALGEIAHRTHYDTAEALRALIPSADRDGGPSLGLWHFRYVPGFWNQGKKMPFPLEGTADRPQHLIGKEQCLAGLRGVELQTASQKARCKGAANMVPIYRGGREEDAKVCIDLFEYPNAACELPLVWGNPSDAAQICAADGKRLCAQSEWNLACGGDPAGGPDWRYSYGSEPDLEICNSNKPHPMRGTTGMWVCNANNARAAWDSCASETEPVGSFPKCRSRFGVFDLHGNIAEMMTRKEGTTVVTQLKGSAFFYVDVFRRHDDPTPRRNGRETYPDHCTFDPRWHVEELTKALHSNYHLGFRCCKDV